MRPIAGPLPSVIFALGIIGTGLLALPVLAGSSAYALGETFGWNVGLARKPGRAKAFYGSIAVATLIGVGLNFSPIDPIKALFWSAVINGLAAVPMMGMMMHLSSKPAAMGDFQLHIGLKIVGWHHHHGAGLHSLAAPAPETRDPGLRRRVVDVRVLRDSWPPSSQPRRAKTTPSATSCSRLA